ncbi:MULTISPECIES: lectin [Oxalobacteraceae]|uniref:jacalin-like lectin n=1 Tax=Herminiimonas sp. Marseille-P9896 TaxID=2742211 RepID=UPI001589A144|nr:MULTISPECIES: lectin [Oxalobacteraceae]
MASSVTAARFSVSRILKKTFTLASFLLVASLAIQQSAHASDAPNIKPALKKMLGGLALDVKDDLQKMVSDLKKTSCGGGLSGCYSTSKGKVQLYFFTSNSAQQTFIIVVDKQISMPKLFGNKVQNVMGQTSLRSLMISISTAEFDLTTARMPPDLKKVVDESYFGVSSLNFAAGAQMAARANLGGPIKLTMESLGVRADQLTMRAAIVMPIPMDISSGAGTGIDVASEMADGATMKQAGAKAAMPEAFVEFQFAPGSRLPMLLPPVTLTDATFFINNSLTFGYKGNAQFQGVGDKKILLQFQTPLTPEGAMDFLDFNFRMATPASFTMEDAARVIVAMASPDARLAKYGGGFIRGVGSFKEPLLAMAKPLAMFKMKNPNPPPEYKFGDATKPWPENDKYFNIIVLGPLADGGPYYASGGQVAAFGQTLGWTDVSAGVNGYYNGAGADVSLRLGPLGKVPFRLSQETRIDMKRQDMAFRGNLAGQKIGIVMGPTKMSIEVNASCINPFEIKTSLEIKPTTDLAQIFDAEGGVNVDPSKITGCIGKELEAAYRKIAGEYKNLSGYTADMANAELKKISDAALIATKAAEDAAKKAAAESQKAAEDAAKASQKAAEDAAKAAQKAADDARKQYEQTKNAARDVANKATNAASNAFRDAGNAFKRLGKKKKHKKGPDPKFAASVFDWDYYYDKYPDVVNAKVDLKEHWMNNGFNEGRQGSPEFSATYYWNRYLDVQAACPTPSNKLQCALQNWLDEGIALGRQGSADVSMQSYLNRYSDLQNAFGVDNYDDALDHWMNYGEDENRNARPDSDYAGPVAGPRRAGGGGGGQWSDAAQCRNTYVIGFKTSSGKRLDGVQFLYANGQWGGVHGKLKNTQTVMLAAGEYITRVDYRSGGSMDAVTFISNQGRTFGRYGGTGGGANSYSVTPGQKLGCMAGRSGSEVDQLIFSSTGPR